MQINNISVESMCYFIYIFIILLTKMHYTMLLLHTTENNKKKKNCSKGRVRMNIVMTNCTKENTVKFKA